jgi:hypothetical protein
VQGDNLDPSDDVYVLGICLYEALSGHSVEPGDYKPLSTINELIPPAIDELVRKCIAPKPRRLKSAADFRNQLRAALNGHRTLSEVLSAGQLHEVVEAISSMTPAQFAEIRAGQRLLVLQKCMDMVESNDRRLMPARNQFLCELTRLGVYLDPTVYLKIVGPAVHFGFGEPSADGELGYGVPIVREALTLSAGVVETDNHRSIVKALSTWLDTVVLEEQRSGFYHNLRPLVCALMANPACHDDDAQGLADVLNRVNTLQRSRSASDLFATRNGEMDD